MHYQKQFRSGRRQRQQTGQIAIYAVLLLGFTLIAFVAFAVDFTNAWFHKQSAQTAADAACEAGAMDLLMMAESTPIPGGVTWTSWGGFGATPSDFSCTTGDARIPCKYAALNGYPGGGLISDASNDVSVTFPTTGPNGETISSAYGVTTPAFISVTVRDRLRAYFAPLITGSNTLDVSAKASCGLVPKSVPTPIVVLHPSAASAFSISGTPSVTILGGPQRSIQVNSSNVAAASGGGTINLTQAGPSFTGGDLGVFGGPSSAMTGFTTGSTGKWVYPASPFSDPYAQVNAPAQPATAGSITHVNFGDPGGNGCPDPTGCDEYSPGYYATGINVVNKTAIFDPGLYYLDGGFQVSANGAVRPSTATGDGSEGVVFYLHGAAAINGTATSLLVSSNSVTDCPLASTGQDSKNCLARYVTAGGTESYLIKHGNSTDTKSVTSPPMKCSDPSAPNPPSQVPAHANGNILFGPCTGAYGDPQHQYRGFLFFQDRSVAAAPSWSGGAQFLLAGLLYFHECKSDGTGVNCSAAGSGGYGTTLSLGGNSGSTAYTIGNIVTDQLQLAGNSAITMILNPNARFSILKAQVLQ